MIKPSISNIERPPLTFTTTPQPPVHLCAPPPTPPPIHLNPEVICVHLTSTADVK